MPTRSDFESTYAFIEYLLENYNALKANIRERELIFEYIKNESLNEAIAGQALRPKPFDTPQIQSGGFFTDSMWQILSSAKREQWLAYEDKAELQLALSLTRQIIDKLDYYLSHLAQHLYQVIKALYFDKKPWRQIKRDLHIASDATINKYRQQAIQWLAEVWDGRLLISK